MKRILGDAKSQMDQNLCGLFWSFTQFFTSGQNYPMSHPPYELFIENAHEKFSLNLQLSTPMQGFNSAPYKGF